MSKSTLIGAFDPYIITGFISAGSIGYALLQLAGFFVAGILGALGAWLAKELIIPRLVKYIQFFKKRNDKSN